MFILSLFHSQEIYGTFSEQPPRTVLNPLNIVITQGLDTDMDSKVFVVSSLLSRSYKSSIQEKTGRVEDVRHLFDEVLVHMSKDGPRLHTP